MNVCRIQECYSNAGMRFTSHTLRIFVFIAILSAFSFSVRADSAVPRISPSAKLSVLTCSLGPDLYSIYGHSAIRFQDSIDGQWIDWVYNYGTFNFTEDFYFKFARGKLDYTLSKSTFPDFQYEYIYTGRGIREQELNFNLNEKQRLFDLLEENYLPENRLYRYDFFYDNCATRIRDMLKRASGDNLKFTYVYPEKYTFREAIQNYLQYDKWGDLGIDLALGMPCDKVMGQEDCMFLPDSLMKEIDYAAFNDGALVRLNEEILPQEYFPVLQGWLVPLNVFFCFFILQLALGWWKKNRSITSLDRLLLFVSGVVGCALVFLWFFTDHTATKWNLNLLWANPLNVIWAFTPISGFKSRRLKWMSLYLVLLSVVIIGWFLLPQELNPAVFPIALGLVYIAAKTVRPGLVRVKNAQ